MQTDTQIELAVLGAALLSEQAAEMVTSRATSGWFTLPEHASIYTAIRTQLHENQPLDPVLICERAIAGGMINQDAAGVVFGALETVGHDQHVRYYLDRLEQQAQRRQLRLISETLSDAADDPTAKPGEVTADLIDQLEGIGEQHAASINTAEALARWQHARDNPARTLPTGWRSLDIKIKGWHPAHLIYLAARPGVGKSIAALQTAANLANCGQPALFFSLEMLAEEIIERLRGAYSLDEIREMPLRLADDVFAFQKICSMIRSDVRRRGTALVVIDYLQLMEPPDARAHREQQIAGMSRGLKKLAQQLGITIVCVAQLNREVDKRNHGRPRLSDLRESGTLEQDANIVLFLWRPNQPSDQTEDSIPASMQDNETGFMIAKCRNGRTGEFATQLDAKRMQLIEPKPDIDGINL